MKSNEQVFRIEGEPGQNNTFINIGTVQNFNPNATTVINNNYGTRGEMSAPNSDIASVSDKSVVRQEILSYVEKTLPFVNHKWKDKYMDIWNDILDLPEVDAVIYNRGHQQDTIFNRKELCHIIHYVGFEAYDGCGIFENYNATHIANCFRDGKEKSTRPELGYNPSMPIRKAIDTIIKKQQK